MRTVIFFVLLALAAVTGFYVELEPSWTAVFRAHLLIHPILGVSAAIASIGYLRAHVPDKGWSRAKVGAVLGLALSLVWLACVVTGVAPLALLRTNRRVVEIHGWIGWAMLPVFALHVLRTTWLMLRERSRWSRWSERLRVPTAARIGVLVVLAWTLVLAIDRPRWQSLDVHFHEFLDGRPPAVPVATSLSMTTTCGQGSACHGALTEEFERSAHHRSPESAHFRKITALLGEERGQPAARFCTSCHAPGQALSEASVPDTPETGLGCLACHGMGAASLSEHPGDRYAEGPKEGFTARLQLDHLSLFPGDGRSPVGALADFLIRLDPAAHARLMRPAPIESDAVCLACHQEHIPRRGASNFTQARCVDCHMTMQRSFSESGQRKPHLFLGANVALPRLLGDAEMERKVTGWLTGHFETRALDAFWELRSQDQKQQSKAVWLFMAVEPAATARPGEILKLRVSTSNVGIGHPFPSGVVDLYDVWLEVKVVDANGTPVYSSGRPGGVASDDDGVIRLGGFVADAEGHAIERHRIWEQHERKIQAVDPNRTMTHELEFPVPSAAVGPLRVEAKWIYDRLNAPFVAWAYAGHIPDLPRVVVTSVEQKIPLAIE